MLISLQARYFASPRMEGGTLDALLIKRSGIKNDSLTVNAPALKLSVHVREKELNPSCESLKSLIVQSSLRSRDGEHM